MGVGVYVCVYEYREKLAGGVFEYVVRWPRSTIFCLGTQVWGYMAIFELKCAMLSHQLDAKAHCFGAMVNCLGAY